MPTTSTNTGCPVSSLSNVQQIEASIMSEHSTTNTQAPESVTGLAITVDSLRSDLHHHIEHSERWINELGALVGEETAARETAHAELETQLAELVGVVEEAIAMMQDYVSRNGGKPAKPETQRTTNGGTPPERKRNESDKELYAWLVEWSEDHDVNAPPKPGGGMFAPGYDKALAPWRAKIAT